MSKCDTPVEMPGGITLGCTLEAGHTEDHTYVPDNKRFDGKVLLCPICSTTVDPLEDGDSAVRECENCETVFIVGTTDTTDAELPTDEHSEDFGGAILLCPVCQTATDAKGWGVDVYACADCDTPFVLNVDPSKVREHSMY